MSPPTENPKPADEPSSSSMGPFHVRFRVLGAKLGDVLVEDKGGSRYALNDSATSVDLLEVEIGQRWLVDVVDDRGVRAWRAKSMMAVVEDFGGDSSNSVDFAALSSETGVSEEVLRTVAQVRDPRIAAQFGAAAVRVFDGVQTCSNGDSAHSASTPRESD